MANEIKTRLEGVKLVPDYDPTFVPSQIGIINQGVDDLAAMCESLEAELADLKAKCDAMKEALRELCEMLESQPSYESFHEYELSGTPDLCRRCGKYAGHAYHGRGLAKAQAAIKAMESEQPTGEGVE